MDHISRDFRPPNTTTNDAGVQLVLFALEPGSYSEAIGGAVADLRPALEVSVVDADDLPAEIARRTPTLVLSGRPRPEELDAATRWAEYRPYDEPDIVRVDGRAERFPGFDLGDVLGLVDRLAGEAGHQRAPDVAEDADAKRARRVLIVEDHVAFSDAIVFLLGRRPSEGGVGPAAFSQARTLAEGLELTSGGTPFDLAVVDLVLPDGDGLEVVCAIKGSSPATPVAVLSAVENLSGALAAGADETIGKEFSMPEIVARLASLVPGRVRTRS